MFRSLSLGPVERRKSVRLLDLVNQDRDGHKHWHVVSNQVARTRERSQKGVCKSCALCQGRNSREQRHWHTKVAFNRNKHYYLTSQKYFVLETRSGPKRGCKACCPNMIHNLYCSCHVHWHRCLLRLACIIGNFLSFNLTHSTPSRNRNRHQLGTTQADHAA